MAETINVILTGDLYGADSLRKYALLQLMILKQAMSFQRLQQGERTLHLNGGSVIHCKSCFGIHTVTIHVPPVKPELLKEPEIPETGKYFFVYVVIGGGIYIFGITKKGKVKYIKKALVKINKGDEFVVWEAVYSNEVNDHIQITLPQDLVVRQMSNGTIYCQYGPHPAFKKDRPGSAHSHCMYYDHERKCITYAVTRIDKPNKQVLVEYESFAYEEDIDAFAADAFETVSKTFTINTVNFGYDFDYLQLDTIQGLCDSTQRLPLCTPTWDGSSWKLAYRFKRFTQTDIKDTRYTSTVSLHCYHFSNGWFKHVGFTQFKNVFCVPHYRPDWEDPGDYHRYDLPDYTAVISSHLWVDILGSGYGWLTCGIARDHYLLCGFDVPRTAKLGQAGLFYRFYRITGSADYDGITVEQICSENYSMRENHVANPLGVGVTTDAGGMLPHITESTYDGPCGPIILYASLAHYDDVYWQSLERQVGVCDIAYNPKAAHLRGYPNNYREEGGHAFWDNNLEVSFSPNEGFQPPAVGLSLLNSQNKLVPLSNAEYDVPLVPHTFNYSGANGQCEMHVHEYNVYGVCDDIPYISSGSSAVLFKLVPNVTLNQVPPACDRLYDQSEIAYTGYYPSLSFHWNGFEFGQTVSGECQPGWEGRAIHNFSIDAETSPTPATLDIIFLGEHFTMEDIVVVDGNIFNSTNFFNSIECKVNNLLAVQCSDVLKVLFRNTEDDEEAAIMDITQKFNAAISAAKMVTANSQNPIAGPVKGIFWCPEIPSGFKRIAL